jgi:hypothetical protein
METSKSDMYRSFRLSIRDAAVCLHREKELRGWASERSTPATIVVGRITAQLAGAACAPARGRSCGSCGARRAG